MLPFLIVGAATTLYVLWALTAFPFEVYIKEHSIVYHDSGTSSILLGALYVISTCGSLFFSRVKAMVFLAQ